MVGITAYGGYVPRLRLQRAAIVEANGWFNSGLKAYGRGERAICNWDEDALTMAVEAGRDCLAGERPNDLKAVFLASTTLPFQDRQCASVLTTALSFGQNLLTLDVTASQRAGTSGLITALQTMKGLGGHGLYVAAEHRRTKAASVFEMTAGDGAAALMLGSENVIAEYVDSHQAAVDFVDRYRGQNEAFDYGWEERWIRDEGYMKIVPPVIQALLEKTGIAADAVDRFVMPGTIRNLAQSVARAAGLKADAVADNLAASMGDAGTAHALVLLVAALEQAKPGETILVVGWGQGADAILFRTTEALAQLKPRVGIKGHLARRKEETNYAKFLSFNDIVEMDRGLRSEVDKQTALSSLYRNREMLIGFVGGKCRVCGTVQFPKSNVCVNPNCGEFHTQDDHPFADTPAKVQSWTADNLTYSLDPPQHFGMVVFEEGGRLMADLTDVDAGSVEVGMPLRMMFRVKEHDNARGFTKYFWKAAPAYSAG
jgi:3-hydroxy-3-methylglutaryl CoA synthase